MKKDNLLLIVFIIFALYNVVVMYGGMTMNNISGTNIFSFAVSFMGLGMMVQKKVRIY